MDSPPVLPLRDGTRIFATGKTLVLERQDPKSRKWLDCSTAIDLRDWLLRRTADEGEQ
jgi:hypothetical protein